MRRIEWGDVGMAILWIIVIIIIINFPAKAQDNIPTVCRDNNDTTLFIFHIPSEWNNPDLPSWWAWGSFYQPINDTTIIVTASQEVEIYGEGFPQWEQDLRVGQALVGSGDYSIILVGDANTALCDVPTQSPTENAPMPTVELKSAIPIVPVPVVSTGRVCTIKYPEIILVCNG